MLKMIPNFNMVNIGLCRLSRIAINLRRYTASHTITQENIATAGTIQDIKDKLINKMGVQNGYKQITMSRKHLLEFLPKKQEELPPRTMNDSFASALVPLSKDPELQNKYITFLGHVRIGRLLEDMDIFAVYISHLHLLNPKQPDDKPTAYTIVTALVDKIDFTDFIPKPDQDIRISGHVSWVGKTSIEVVVWLEQLSYGEWHRITRALFLMAARDPAAEHSAFVNPLVATNEREAKILSGGEVRRKQRQLVRSRHLTKVIPTDEEQNIVHDLFLRTLHFDNISLKKRNLPHNAVWMENATLSNIVFSQPENRNLHNRVFGGFLMRQAMEVSWALGYLFTKHRAKLKTISDISFNRSIEVSSIIRMHASVVYTYKQYFQVTVYGETWDPTTGKSFTTNIFHFTYEVPEEVPEIFPHTYHEAMMYIDGRRHFYDVMQHGSSG